MQGEAEMKNGFGAFGKMPSLGDFFRLNCGAGFVQPWDSWVQHILLTGHQTYGAGFDDLYMHAPIWRFALSGGNAGAAARIGVMMPSVDRVGRRFPLTLMQPVQYGSQASVDWLGDEDLFCTLEDIALQTLEDGTSPDDLAARLAGVTSQGPAIDLPASTASPPSFWAALWEGAMRSMTCTGLPQGERAMALFDMSAPFWQKEQPA